MLPLLAKMHGAANDFVVVPSAVPADAAELVRALADRRRGIGADGVLFIERIESEDLPAIRMHFYNRDGSRAGLCLNGSRCVALRAVQLGWARDRLQIGTDRQQIEASVVPDAGGRRAEVTLELEPPRALARQVRLPEGSVDVLGAEIGTLVDTGDPHLVVEVRADIVARGDFAELARPLRHSTGKAGANVHFVHRTEKAWIIRSFERGVEDETLACGSGCVSSVCALSGVDVRQVYELHTRSGERLRIRTDPSRWTLQGPAELNFETQWLQDD